MSLIGAGLSLAISTQNISYNTQTPSGFKEEYKLNDVEHIIDDSYGYMYYTFNIFSTSFAYNESLNISARLFLVQMNIQFTPGYIANLNKESGFNGKSYLKYMKLSMKYSEYENEDLQARSSSFTVEDWTPTSSEVKSRTIGFSNGYTASFSLTTGVAIDLDNGITLSANQTRGFTISHSSSSSTTTSDPLVSSQRSNTDKNNIIWNIIYNDKGKTTYYLNAYTFLIVYDNGRGYPDYAFNVKAEVETAYTYKASWFSYKTVTYNHAKTFLFNDTLI